MLTVALSGGIASGKTLISDTLASFNVPIIDTDILAREVVAAGTDGLQKIVDRFGNSVLNKAGTLDRKKLREQIFIDSDARTDLEAIIHPLVRELVQLRLSEHKQAGALYCVVVIPLLLETKQQDQYDHIVIVDVEPKVQLERVMKRDNSTRQQAERIIASQVSSVERLAVADDVIFNSSTTTAAVLQVKKLHERLQKIAAKKNRDK